MPFLFKFTEKPYAHQGPIITIKLIENAGDATVSHSYSRPNF